eukprot:Rhum_TRINITY_DN13993_c0_g3::Rhum_TRINITY_DN13993_c0_g3_i1::g.66647::m.66647
MKDFAPETEPYQEWIGGLYQRRSEAEAPVHDRLYRQGVERVARTLQAPPPPRVDPEAEALRECVFRPALSDRTAQLANRHNQSRQDVVARLTRKDDGARSRRGSVAEADNGALPEQQQQQQQPAGSDRQPARSGPNVWDRLGAAPIRNFREPAYAERNEATFRPLQPQAQIQQQQQQQQAQPQRRNVFDRLYQQPTESARRRSESVGSRGSRGKAAAVASADVEVEVLDSGVFDRQTRHGQQPRQQAYPQHHQQQHAYAHEFSEPAVDEYADNVIVIGESSATAVVSQPQPMQQKEQQQLRPQQQQPQFSQHLQQQQHYPQHPQHHQPQDSYDHPPYGHDDNHHLSQQQQHHGYAAHPPTHHTPDDLAPLSPLSEDTLVETVPSQGQACVPAHPSYSHSRNGQSHHPLQRQPSYSHADDAAPPDPVVASQQHRAASSSSLPPPPPPAAASAYAAIAAGDLAGFQRAYDGAGAALAEGERDLSFLAAAVLADAPAIAGFLCSGGVLSVAAPAVASSPYRAAAGDGDACERNPRHVLFRCPSSGRNALHLAAVHKRAACVRAIAAALPGTTTVTAAGGGARSGSAASSSSGGAAPPSAFADLLCSRDAHGLTPLMLAAGASRDGLFLPSVERHLPPAGHGYAGVSVRCADGPLLGRMADEVDTAGAAAAGTRHLLFSWRNSFELSVAGAGGAPHFRCSVDLKATGTAAASWTRRDRCTRRPAGGGATAWTPRPRTCCAPCCRPAAPAPRLPCSSATRRRAARRCTTPPPRVGPTGC